MTVMRTSGIRQSDVNFEDDGVLPPSVKRSSKARPMVCLSFSSSPCISSETLKRRISSRPDPDMARFLAEAESCINVITRNDNGDEEEMGSVPFTASLAADERFGLRFLAVHRNAP
ncbi:hypothetical protein QJS10_CPA07g00363 [Acorus calamus]|uniref:Josephin-like protein n=1 Tax=Acorus calamus TaxID=4465 RepID=A0AAV9EHW4_ACOCL|nr:hypothetical protein QJS10_CPA07g00363 [Acorus calamus]